jgi:hypothetical protein
MDRCGIQVHPRIQTIFQNSCVVFWDDNVPIHTAATVQSWFDECGLEPQHLHHVWISLNHSGQLWRRVWNRFPPPTSVKHLEHVLQEEWYNIPLEIVQNLYVSKPRRIAAVLVQHWINGEASAASAVRPLLCTKWGRKSLKKLNSVAWVRERTTPTERPPLVGEVNANFYG